MPNIPFRNVEITKPSGWMETFFVFNTLQRPLISTSVFWIFIFAGIRTINIQSLFGDIDAHKHNFFFFSILKIPGACPAMVVPKRQVWGTHYFDARSLNQFFQWGVIPWLRSWPHVLGTSLVELWPSKSSWICTNPNDANDALLHDQNKPRCIMAQNCLVKFFVLQLAISKTGILPNSRKCRMDLSNLLNL